MIAAIATARNSLRVEATPPSDILASEASPTREPTFSEQKPGRLLKRCHAIFFVKPLHACMHGDHRNVTI